MESRTLLSAILAKLPNIGKWQREFIIHLIPLFMSIKGRINFMQMSRYGTYSMTTYRNNFDKPFDFGLFNAEHIRQQGSGHHAIIFDPSHIQKSGKHTFGKGKFWSGCDSSVKPGLEIGGIAVGDIIHHAAFHYEAVQTPSPSELKSNGTNLLVHYAQVLVDRKESLLTLSNIVLVDAYFSKSTFVSKILEETDFHIISRFRDDAVLYYLHQGGPTGRRGRPRLYQGKVDKCCPDMKHFSLEYQDEQIKVFSAVVFAKSLGIKVRLALVHYFDGPDSCVKTKKIYFSTDLNIPAWYIAKYYQLRFQIEFLYRDSNQFTGLEQCQARGEQRLHFHFNTALTSVSVARSAHWLNLPKEERGAFSMADVKTQAHNQLLMERFFDVFAIDPNTPENIIKAQKLRHFGAMAA
jgi:hypothetical protein